MSKAGHSRGKAESQAVARVLAADYKHKGVDRQTSWSYFVKDRNLRPGIDAKEYYAIFESVEPCPLPTVEKREVEPTHRLVTEYCGKRYEQLVKVTLTGFGFVQWIATDGMTGSDPDMYIVSLEPLTT